MKPPVERIKVSKKGKDILIKIKRNTGLQHWNEICRLALCKSLADPSPPPERAKTGDSNIEMDWKTFAGEYQEFFIALLRIKGKQEFIDIYDKNEFLEYVRKHVERGINLLKNINNVQEITNSYL